MRGVLVLGELDFFSCSIGVPLAREESVWKGKTTARTGPIFWFGLKNAWHGISGIFTMFVWHCKRSSQFRIANPFLAESKDGAVFVAVVISEVMRHPGFHSGSQQSLRGAMPGRKVAGSCRVPRFLRGGAGHWLDISHMHSSSAVSLSPRPRRLDFPGSECNFQFFCARTHNYKRFPFNSAVKYVSKCILRFSS